MSDRANYYADRAALLDPNAYVFLGDSTGTGRFDHIVPAGETWYLLQGWFLWGSLPPITQTQTPHWFHRSGGVEGAKALPAGTRIRTQPGVAGQVGFAYVCKPALVQQDPRYRQAEDLYWARKRALDTGIYGGVALVRNDLTCVVDSGVAIGTSKACPFPGGVASRVIVVHESMHGGAWLTLAGTTDPNKVINLNYEISDYHEHRYGLADIYPVKPADFDAGVVITNARRDGAASGNGDQVGYGRIVYYELPANW